MSLEVLPSPLLKQWEVIPARQEQVHFAAAGQNVTGIVMGGEMSIEAKMSEEKVSCCLYT